MEQPLGFDVRMAMPLPQAVEVVTEALKQEGFGVLTRIDVRATLQEKMGKEFRPYVILGACNPPLAYCALEPDHLVAHARDPGDELHVIGQFRRPYKPGYVLAVQEHFKSRVVHKVYLR
jgi:hypothetical protein